MNQLVTTSISVTISSIDLVAIINSMREPSRAELLHKNFMVKIENHPAIDAPKFLGTQKYGNNISRNIYNLPKREASLMVMSESIPTKVYGKMVALKVQEALHPKFHSKFPSG